MVTTLLKKKIYDPDDQVFVEDTVTCIPDAEGGPHHFNMDWVKKN